MRLVLAMVFAGLVALPLRVSAQAEEYEAVETDTSDDAFLIIVTKKYEEGELTGATVLIKHKESGQYAIPYVDAVEIDTLDQVIREHKAKLLRAQVGEQVEASEPDVVEAAPTPEPALEEPALQLQLDDAGVEVVPSPPRTFDGYTLEELELRKRRAAFGLIAPAAVTAAGVALLVRGKTGDCAAWAPSYPYTEPYSPNPERCDRHVVSGIALTTAGGVGMLVGSFIVGARTYKLKSPVHIYTLEELEVREKRQRIAVSVSAPTMVAGIGLFIGGGVVSWNCFLEDPDCGNPEVAVLLISGGILAIGGLIGTIASSIRLRRSRRYRDSLQEARYGRRRRVQWDIAHSRLVF